MKEVSFMVSLKRPVGSTIEDVQTYIEDAVRSWAGGFHPDDLLFKLDKDSVSVKYVPVSHKRPTETP